MPATQLNDFPSLSHCKKIEKSLAIGLWSYDLNSEELEWSDVTREIHEVDEHYQATLNDAIEFYSDIEPGKLAISEVLKRGISSGESWDLECRLTTAKGRAIWVRTIGHSVTNDAGEVVRFEGAIQDITNPREVNEDANRARKELEYQTYALNNHAIVSIGDLEGKILYANENFCRISGYTSDELQQHNHSIVNSRTHTKDFWLDFWNTISSGQVYRGEMCNRAKNGALYWVNSTVVPHINSEGEIDRYVAIRTDVTEKKAVEEKRQELEKSLYMMQKMETIGQFVGGIAHDFNNILAVTIGYSQLLSMDLEDSDDDDMKFNIYQIESSGHRAKDLVKKLLAFARGSTEDSQKFSASEHVSQFLDTIRPIIPTSVGISIQTSEDPLPIQFNKTGLDQILMNLCINARDALPNGGHICIAANRTRIHQQRCASCFSEFSGEYVNIQVRDTGTGLEAASIAKLFEPFFSTKEVGKGSGMGLSVVHGLTHGVGGHITLESDNQGTNFSILLPIVGQPESRQQLDIPHIKSDFGELSFIVVDDEVAIANMIKSMLKRSGASVLQYTDSKTLLEDLYTSKVSADILITDLTMPRVTGIELCHAAKKYNPQIKVIAMSGYSDRVSETNFHRYGFDSFIAKPVEISKLEDRITQVTSNKIVTRDTQVNRLTGTTSRP